MFVSRGVPFPFEVALSPVARPRSPRTTGCGRSYSVSIMLRFIFATACLALCSAALHAQTAMHVWAVREIELRAAHPYANPYTDVDCRLDLQGCRFSQRVYGFWDGGDTFLSL